MTTFYFCFSKVRRLFSENQLTCAKAVKHRAGMTKKTRNFRRLKLSVCLVCIAYSSVELESAIQISLKNSGLIKLNKLVAQVIRN